MRQRRDLFLLAMALLVLCGSPRVVAAGCEDGACGDAAAAEGDGAKTLAAKVLTHGKLLQLFAYNDPEFGIDRLRRELPELDLLLKDSEATDALLYEYEAIDLGTMAELVDGSLGRLRDVFEKALGESSLQALAAELLLTSDLLVADVETRFAPRFLDAFAEKTRARAAHPDLLRGSPEAVWRRAGDIGVLSTGDLGGPQQEALMASCGPGLGGLEGVVGTALTPGGSSYSICNVSSEWSAVELSQLTSFWQSEYGGIAIIVSPVTQKYICHSYSLRNSIGIEGDTSQEPPVIPDQYPFITEPFQQLLNAVTTDSSVVRVTDFADADLVFYTNQGEFFDHSGVPGDGCPGGGAQSLGCIQSKWGWGGPVMLHLVGNDPYWGNNPDIDPLTMQSTDPSPDADGAKYYVETPKTSMTVEPPAGPVGPQPTTVPVPVMFVPGSLVNANWSAAIISGDTGDHLPVSSGGHNDLLWLSLVENTSSDERKIVVRVDGNAGDSYIHHYRVDFEVIQEGVETQECVPATPDLVEWPDRICVNRLNHFEIAAETCAVTYEWRVDNPAISLGASGTSAWVDSSEPGTTGRLYWRACNGQGECSPEGSVHLYFNSCGKGGGGGGTGGGGNGPQNPV